MSVTRDPGDDAIAVVGLSCRLPGASTPQAFWELLRAGESTVAVVDEDGRRESRLPGPDRFDAAFFGIAPREAAAMDPQQRLMLEMGWEAIEDAGIRPERLRGTATGVFVGVASNDYALIAQRPGAAAPTHHAMTGLHRSLIANRLSYLWDLRGPSTTVDSGQASSLVAVHLACAALRAGDAGLALAGGIQLNLARHGADVAAAFGALSPDGEIRTLDAAANGFVRGEGGGVVVLKPLARAVADGDRLYAVIAGSAVNNDGRTEGLTVPSAQAQAAVIRAAHRRAGVGPADVGYIELHGTGTRLGDRTEALALGDVVGGARPAGDPLRVGSVKTNVGHLEAAAGVVGFIKVTLTVSSGTIPPSRNFRTPPADLPLDELGLRVQTTAADWPGSRVAGVSSFSMGGTNCHVVVTSPPSGHGRTGAGEPRTDTAPGVLPWVVSARGETALRAQSRRLLDRVTAAPGRAADVAYSLATTRSAHTDRAVILAPGTSVPGEALAALAAGDTPAGSRRGVAEQAPEVAFVLADDAGPYLRAARDLAAGNERYRDLLLESGCTPQLLDGDETADEPAVQVAVLLGLAAVWRAHGVTPVAVVPGSGVASRLAAAVMTGETDRAAALRALAGGALPGPGRQPAADAILVDPGLRRLPGPAGAADMDPSDVLAAAGVRPSGPAALVAALAELFVRGLDVEWGPLFPAGSRVVDLPFYPFQRESYWWRGETEEEPVTAPSVSPGIARRPSRRHLDLVLSGVGEVLGGSGFSPGTAFRDLGFDSLMLVELRSRLAAATGLALPSSMLFDYPTPAAVAEFLDAGESPEVLPDRELPASDDDPIVVVSMGCRLPGGVSTPEDLWDVVAAGRDVITDFPQDRGWDPGLVDPVPGVPGRTYVGQG
ncbi:beta-ketoacyl synthase N-terminal-like domain-containing protein, partial [Actinoplanes missouriensis]|uniref:beta-ketoacyl synthase N-terminal-like domain-containing protein n=1 Tax=Actinoplanes missouriensis TaxID=1866 RepID=UPI00340F6452